MTEETEAVEMPPIYKVVDYKLSQRHRIEEWVYLAYPGRTKKNPLHPGIEKHMFVGFTAFPGGMELQFGLAGPNIHSAAMSFGAAEEESIAKAKAEAEKPQLEIVSK